jgi:dTDP-4-amino-4,6-dideoxygalactose transaminase
MKSSPFDINREFEKELESYTRAPFAVLTNSCTMALRLCLDWHMERGNGDVTVTIPSRTYCSVPMQIKAAGFNLAFRDEDWKGQYRLDPLPIWDSARYFTSGMFSANFPGALATYQCVSFHSTKILGIKRLREDGGWDIEQGGAILHNSPEADKWFRRARFDGRTEGVAPKDDTFDMIGHHCYMSPATARLGLQLLRQLPKNNAPLPNNPYPDLSLAPIFRR